MRKLYFIFLLIFVGNACLGQKLEMQLDSINYLIKNDEHGRLINKYFSLTFYQYPKSDTALPINKTRTRHLQMNAFYSNKLAVNYFFSIKKIPQLTDYVNDHSKTQMYMFVGYNGNYAIPILDSSGIIITVNGINRQNVDQYQFRVLENKTKVVLPWTKPKLFTPRYWQTRIADSTKIDTETVYLVGILRRVTMLFRGKRSMYLAGGRVQQMLS